MELTVVKNKRTGQWSLLIPKGVAEIFEMKEKTRIDIRFKNRKKKEFILSVE